MAVQLAKRHGAHVIGTARTVNHRFLRELGADELIDHTTTDFTTTHSDVDVVLDLVGGSYGARSLQVLSAGGRYIGTQSCDAGNDPRIAHHTTGPSVADLTAIGDLTAGGRLRIHIDRVLPLAEAAQAHRLSETGRVRGKLVLTPW